ncbi:MAG: carbohydrate-binding domain-containing protein [Saccharofermentans sp.]|nr:carbohydrate-binding domain-containing protein [Saccharofermentans sp.]
MKDYRAKHKIIALILAASLAVSAMGCEESGENAQPQDVSSDETIELTDELGTVTIDTGGTYEITGQTSDGQIIIDTEEDVSLILDGVTIENDSSAAIWIRTEGLVQITLEGENSLINNGGFAEENDDDPDALIYSPGDIIIGGDGTLNLTATAGKGVRANRTLTVNSGVFMIETDEGLEATGVIINGGDITINATDDGINASDKTDEFTPYLEVNGGTINITMADGDTDGLDSNGDITINGGTISINAQSAIDYDGNAVMNGGTLIINGEETTELMNQFPGGMMPPDGERPGRPDGERPPEFPEEM